MLFNNTNMRTAMAYTNAVGDKVYPIIVDIKKGIKSTEEVSFVSSDINTGVLSVAFIQGNDTYNVEGAEVICSIMRPDTTTLEIPCNIINGNTIEVPLGVNGTSQDGVYSFDFKVFKGEDKIVGTPIMNYSVSLSISNDLVVEEDDRLPVLTMLITQVNELKEETRETINQANVATEASKEATAKAIEATNNANVVSERVSQETSEAITRVDNTIVELNNTVGEKISELDNAKTDMTNTVSNKVNEVETRFNTLTSSQQQDAEVIDARDGETSLKARLDRDIEKAKQVYVELEGSYISTESSTGAIQDIQILGNTVQDPNNLADIKSVGELQEDGTYKMSILSCGKNLFNGELEVGDISDSNGSYPSYTASVVRLKDLIKIKPNTNYFYDFILPYESDFNIFYEYDKNKNFIRKIPIVSKCMFTTSENGHYISFKIQNDLNISAKIQIEEGTVATPYEPYQGNKCDILLPCQLEKVGDVSDRLYYDDMEKAWCIEKNIITISVEDVLGYSIQTHLDTVYRAFINTKDLGIVARIKNTFCNCIPANNGHNSWVTDAECVYTDDTKLNRIWFHINKAKFTDFTKDTFENWLSTNNVIVKLKTSQPQKIVLPLSTQIALNSFFGTTHIYMESGEVEGTIKCKIPKSLGATVQSLNNKTDILSDRIEAIEGLKDSQNMKYETDKGYLVCKETKNGVIDDVKLEGKTLVNLNNFKKSSSLSDRVRWENNDTKNIQGGVTVWNLSDKPISVDVHHLDTDTYKAWYNVSSNSCKVISIGNNEKVGAVIGLFVNGWTSSELDKLKKSVIILEGDHTQNPPSYFEGLMSVGQDVDEIVVESVKGDGNLFNPSKFLVNKGSLYGYCKYPTDNRGLTLAIEDRDTSIDISGMYIGLTKRGIDAVGGYHWLVDTGTISGSRVKYSDFEYVSFFPNNKETLEALNKRFKISVYKGKVESPYTPHQSDKKQILFYNENGELEPIQELHEWDSIEKHSDNKWYYHKRSGKRSYQTEDENNSSYITDMTNTVYQLAEEEIYELAPLHLDSYANETLILCNSGAISPKMEFSITSHINELVKSQGDRISLLEEKMYKALKQVLAGDMYSLAELLYPEDFVEENPENEIMLLPLE